MAGNRPTGRKKVYGESNDEGVWKTDKRWHRELDTGPGTGWVKEDIPKGTDPDRKSSRKEAGAAHEIGQSHRGWKKAEDQGVKPISVSDEYYERYRKAVAGRRTGKF